MTEAEREREAIVDWLRDVSILELAKVSGYSVSFKEMIADAIERGDHLETGNE